MIETINYNNQEYLKIQAEGFASQYIFPFAEKFCKGFGYDIGCKKKEWALKDSNPIDVSFNNGFHALNLPYKADYIFSSHCLEHVNNWVEVMDYWFDILDSGGILFLYLPHYDQEYWRPWNNKQHFHILTAKILRDYMTHKGYIKIFCSEKDLNYSFCIIGEKP